MTYLFPPILSAIISRSSILLILLVAAKLLTPGEFDVYALIATVAAIVNALVSGGGDMWLNRFTPQSYAKVRPPPHIWFVYLSLSLIMAAATFALGAGAVLLFDPLPGYAGPFILALAGACLAGMTETMLAVIRSAGNLFVFFSVRDVATPVAYLAAILIIGPATANGVIEIYTLVWLAAFLVTLFLLAQEIALSASTINLRWSAWKPVGRHTASLVYGNFTARFASYFDILVLSAVALGIVGEYRVAAQLAIGFIVIQHFIFLGLPWELRAIGQHGEKGAGFAQVMTRQRALIPLAAFGLVLGLLLAKPLLGWLGDGFVEVVPVLHLLLLVRFADLLWGPQHEVLVSNGRAIEDAHANMLSVPVWAGAFILFRLTSLPDICAIVGATAVAAAGAQAIRLYFLHRAGLPSVFGHPLGAFLPLSLTALVLVGCGFYLYG
ncbi:MAG: hypothetical protein RIE22_10220 [Alphaproteobacteria bacterium]